MRATRLFSILAFACSFVVVVVAAPVETPVINIKVPVNGINNATNDWQPTLVCLTYSSLSLLTGLKLTPTT